MTETDIITIAENANIIVNGYAFTERNDGFVSILNLYHPDCAMVVNKTGEIIETNMDPIEQQIVLDLCEKNLQFRSSDSLFPDLRLSLPLSIS